MVSCIRPATLDCHGGSSNAHEYIRICIVFAHACVHVNFTSTGFGAPKKTSSKPYVAIGPPDKRVNDPTKPEYDDQGYTLYSDEKTGEKSRVFEALVDYPCIFTMKIVGANEGAFVEEMVALVAEACETELANVTHSTRVMGKWMSVTVKTPIQSAEMLYSLYAKVDQDPRVKFKF
mmetsp:Transcript_17467/g.48458  ORF Transcript_17467/g.48458 Transcript_17467/m.48458 type:complete len:176 (-) Transcript_17467:2170-2697(-)